jgi:hypothetical protein
MLERFYGTTITLSSGRVVPVRLIGEQHVMEDLGRIPSFADWVRCIHPEPWMGRSIKLSAQLDPPTGQDASIENQKLGNENET